MSLLEDYIEKAEKETQGMSELDKIRYVYLDLGERLSFNLNFAFGNGKTKREIYKESVSQKAVERGLDENIIICKTSARILEEILNSLGVKIRTVTVPDDHRKCPHVYNIITPADGGDEYIIDLQEDLENIQSHSFTRNFGFSTEERKGRVISPQEIVQSDKRLGYIRDDYYYADEYVYLLKEGMNYFSNIRDKLGFALENLEVYDRPNIKYAERRWHHDKLLSQIFTAEELRKFKRIDCYTDGENGREYRSCIVLQSNNSVDIYLFSTETNRYQKVSMEEFADMVQAGLVPLEGVPGLKGCLRRREAIQQGNLSDPHSDDGALDK